VLSGIGSLSTAGLRFASAERPERLMGDMEIPSLASHKAGDSAVASRPVEDLLLKT